MKLKMNLLSNFFDYYNFDNIDRVGISEDQEVLFKIMEKTSINGFNGKKIVEMLRQYRDLWLSVIIPLHVQKESLLYLPLVKARLSAHAIADPLHYETELYFLTDKESSGRLLQMIMETEAEIFQASEVFTLNIPVYDKYCSSFSIEFSRDFIELLEQKGFAIVYAWWD